MSAPRTSAAGVALIKRQEGLRLKAYRCEAGRLTIGWGRAYGVQEGQRITEAQAEAFLQEDLARFEADVAFLTRGCPLNENEHAALVSFCFNVGSDIDQDNVAEGLGDSTLLRKLLRGDRRGAAECFLAWDKARNPDTGQYERSEGLATRRSRERALFLTPVAEPLPAILEVSAPAPTPAHVHVFEPLYPPRRG